MDRIRDYILTLSDDLLIKVSNKGLVNRAHKDYKEKGIIPQIGESPHMINWEYPSLGIQCSLASANILEARCNCPASGICRHILTGILHLRNFWGNQITGYSEVDPWEKLRVVTDKELVQWMGRKDLENSLKALADGMRIEIKTGNLLEALFPDLDVKCTFLPFAIQGAGICSCKVSNCQHELMAILKFQLSSGRREIHQETVSALSVEAISRLRTLQNLIKELIITGLERTSLQTLNQIEALSIELHNQNLPRMEKELRVIKNHIELYLKKHAQFDKKSYMESISHIYGLTKIVENFDGSFQLTEITGIHKSKYMEIGNINILGAGCRAWKSKSDYLGITLYFLNDKKTDWFSLTISRPSFYEGKKFDPLVAYSSEAVFGTNIPIQEICRRHISLNRASINPDRRLSTSQITSLFAHDYSGFQNFNSSPLCISNWSDLLDKISESDKNLYLREKENSNLFFLKLSGWEKPEFNSVKQELLQTIYDEDRRKIFIRIPFTPVEHLALKNLEALYESNIMPLAILGHVYIEGGCIYVSPVTAYLPGGSQGTDVLNLSLDKWKSCECLPLSDSGHLTPASGHLADNYEIKYLTQILNEIFDLFSEIYSMGLISVNINTLEEIRKCGKLCEKGGLIFAGTVLEKVYTGLKQSSHRLEKMFGSEACELLLLGNWLILLEKEVEIEWVRKNITLM